MRMRVALTMVSLLLFAASTVRAGDPTSLEVEGPIEWGGVQNLTRVGNLWFASQPDEQALEIAKERGIRLVINLREPGEQEWPEGEIVERLGMEYRNIPVSTTEPFSREAFRQIDEQVDAHANENVLIHCSSANRAAGWFATRLALREGMAIDRAIEVGRRTGITKEPIAAGARAYVHQELARRRADAAADLLPKKLVAELQAAMQRGGATEAVRVCSGIAQEISDQVGKDEGVVVRRTSLKYRHPQNAPDDFERAWLTQAEDAMRHGRAPQSSYEVIEMAGGRSELRHLRPIVFPGGICSNCHGSDEEIAPETRALLRERYPDDRAVGFQPGDLRGAISVRVPIGAADSEETRQ